MLLKRKDRSNFQKISACKLKNKYRRNFENDTALQTS